MNFCLCYFNRRGLSKYCEGRSRAFNDMTVLETRRMEDLFSPAKPYKKQNKKRSLFQKLRKLFGWKSSTGMKRRKNVMG